MGVFDVYSKAAFATVSGIVGDAARWTPSNSDVEQTAIVLYNRPDKDRQLGDTDKYTYDPYDHTFEYYEGDFAQLKSLVDSGEIEKVNVAGIYLEVREVKSLIDGKNYKAYCSVYENPVQLILNPRQG